MSGDDLTPALKAADAERRRIFRELLSRTSQVDRDRQDLLLFGDDDKRGVVDRALGIIHGFRVHRETRAPGNTDTWWDREWVRAVADWQNALR